MRWFVSIGVVLIAGAMASGDVASVAAPGPKLQPGQHVTDKDAAPTVERLVAAYLQERSAGESFQAYAKRKTDEDLISIGSGQRVAVSA